MKTQTLTLEQASQLLDVPLIPNRKGTQTLLEVVTAYRANRRQGTRATKTKGTVQKSGKKPWRQKGTGRARAGYVASPIWRGGGVVFGPQPRDFSKKIPKRVKKFALKKAFSMRVMDGAVSLSSPIELKNPKTKELLSILDPLNLKGRTLIIVGKMDPKLYLAARNVPTLGVTDADQCNAEDLISYHNIIITEEAMGKIAARLKK
ncbi:MAG: 50S ribosomal protein L4 [Methylacidiphilales bacterium]|nr:50S ribosomal protein L4 [Candidatus Methylacidiphilales bacterium]MDW8348988.1 50S ribosomal protein L4 [Verrucomicrobiae bacterium]